MQKLHLSFVLAGCFTLGAIFGQTEKRAEAHVIEVAPTCIVADPISACTDFEIDESGTAFCWDTGEYYDTDHFMVEADTDSEGYYLGVWQ